jgi:hypothetical protein
MRLRLGGKYWTLRFCALRKHKGECDAPSVKNKQIRIKTNLSEREELEVLIHELLHAVEWMKDEEWVERSGVEISAALWKLGWRKVGEEGSSD